MFGCFGTYWRPWLWPSPHRRTAGLDFDQPPGKLYIRNRSNQPPRDRAIHGLVWNAAGVGRFLSHVGREQCAPLVGPGAFPEDTSALKHRFRCRSMDSQFLMLIA